MNRLRTLVMSLWAVGLLALLVGKRYPLFIRAELWPLLLLTGGMFVLFLIALTSRLGQGPRPITPAAALQAIMLLLPLFFMLGLMSDASASGLNSFALQKRSLGMNTGVESVMNASGDSVAAADAEKPLSLGYMVRHRSKLSGKRVFTEGKVWKDDLLPSGQFAIFRFVVVCCAADAMPVQAVVQSSETSKLKNDQWVHVKGTLTFPETDNGTVAFIDATSVEVTAPPKDPYLSPAARPY